MTFGVALKDTLDAADLAALAQLAGNDAQALGYHAPDYQSGMEAVLGDRCRHILVSDRDGRLSAYLPFRERSGAFGTVLNALPFFGPNGLLLATDDAARDAAVQAFRNAAQRVDALSAVLYTPFLADPEPIAAAFEPDRRLVRMTQYLDLKDFAGWPKKRRGDLKRAAGSNFTIRPARADDLDALFAIYVENCLEVGIPQKPRSYFELTLALAAGTAPSTWQPPLWLAIEHEGAVIGGVLAMRGAVTASYTIPIARSELRPLQPIAALIDAAVESCRAGGIRYWNFESSPNEDDPVFKYKERWGAIRAGYEVQIIYPNGTGRFAKLSPDDLRREYPFYFVCPYDDIKN